jgi:hypothetical protein
VTHGDLQGVPLAEGLAPGGRGHPFTPFYHPLELEIRYCLQLSDWWQEVEKQRQSMFGEAHNVQVSSKASRVQREHRLISDTGPDIAPQGFFDCTVEVSFCSIRTSAGKLINPIGMVCAQE